MDVTEQIALIDEELVVFREDLSVSGEAPEDIQLATKKIHEMLFDHDLMVEKLRKENGLTGATFHARFRHHHDCTPACYIRQLRIEAAQTLLRHEELPAVDIAFHVGYEHYRTFARVFKRVAGLSPQAFREQISEP